MSDILTGTPRRPDLRPRPGAPGVDGRLGHHVRRAGGHPRLDGAELHHGRAPGDPSGGVARDGAPPRPRPRGRRIVPVVVRPGPGRGRRRVGIHSRLPERHGGRPAPLHPPHPDDRRAGRERGHGPAACRPLPRLRLLRPLRDRADGSAPSVDRPPAGPGPHRVGALDICPTRRAGAATGSSSS